MLFWDLREFYAFSIEKYPIWSLFLNMSINASEYQLRFIACLFPYFYKFWLISMDNVLYNQLSSLTGSKHGFKPTHSVVNNTGLFTFFGSHFFFKSCSKPLFTVLWNLRVKSTQFLGHFKWCPNFKLSKFCLVFEMFILKFESVRIGIPYVMVEMAEDQLSGNSPDVLCIRKAGACYGE